MRRSDRHQHFAGELVSKEGRVLFTRAGIEASGKHERDDARRRQPLINFLRIELSTILKPAGDPSAKRHFTLNQDNCHLSLPKVDFLPQLRCFFATSRHYSV